MPGLWVAGHYGIAQVTRGGGVKGQHKERMKGEGIKNYQCNDSSLGKVELEPTVRQVSVTAAEHVG